MNKELTKQNKQVAYKQQKKCLISLFGELERQDKTIFIKCGATGFLLNCWWEYDH